MSVKEKWNIKTALPTTTPIRNARRDTAHSQTVAIHDSVLTPCYSFED